MSKYEVHYAYEVIEGYEDDEGNKFARGKMEIDTDVPIETQEQVKEVTKQVYREMSGGTPSIKQLVVEEIYILDENGAKVELAG